MPVVVSVTLNFTLTSSAALIVFAFWVIGSAVNSIAIPCSTIFCVLFCACAVTASKKTKPIKAIIFRESVVACSHSSIGVIGLDRATLCLQETKQSRRLFSKKVGKFTLCCEKIRVAHERATLSAAKRATPNGLCVYGVTRKIPQIPPSNIMETCVRYR